MNKDRGPEAWAMAFMALFGFALGVIFAYFTIFAGD